MNAETINRANRMRVLSQLETAFSRGGLAAFTLVSITEHLIETEYDEQTALQHEQLTNEEP